MHRCPPKDDSYRTIDTPDSHSRLLAEHVAQTQPKPCRCHGLTYVFSGHRPPSGATRRPGATLVDVPRLAGVSPATASAALNHPEVVAEPTHERIAKAIADLGYVRGGASGELAAHWRRSNFATWLFQPAATGWYPMDDRMGHFDGSIGARYSHITAPSGDNCWTGSPSRGKRHWPRGG